jgi:hypothetical protein
MVKRIEVLQKKIIKRSTGETKHETVPNKTGTRET